MDKELMKLKVGIGILLVGIVVFIFAVSKVIPEIKKVPTTQEEIKTKTSSLEDARRQLEELQAADKKTENEANDLLKIFFTPEETGLDSEAAMGLEFGEILSSLRKNKIKTRSVKYDYDPADDNFVKNAGAKYHACKIDIEMISTYRELESFLRDLYKHPHFLEIAKIETVPYKKNKRILLTSLQIKLYTQKDAAEQAAYVAPAPEQAPPANPEAPQAPAESAPSEAAPQEASGNVSNSNTTPEHWD